MSLDYPDWVNPWKAAEGQRRFRGTIALRDMTRLGALLDGSDGEASFGAAFHKDSLGFTVIDLEVRAELPLRCQATLEPYLEPVHRKTELVVCADEHDDGDVPAHYELTVAEDGRIGFLDLVQDELILAVPQVPRKPGAERIRYTTDPDDRAEQDIEERNRPFAALGELVKGRQDQT